jgi:hypothetical protein
MALLNSRFSNQSADLIAIIGDGFAQVFEQARPIKLTATHPSKIMEHVIEDGSVIADHHVFDPKEIELGLFIGAGLQRDIFAQIERAMMQSDILTVQGKTSVYDDMVITDLGYDETADMYDAAILIVKMRQVVFVEPQYGELPPRKVAEPNNADTKERGQVQGEAAPEEQGTRASVLYSLFYGDTP